MQQILAFTRKEIQLWARRPGSWLFVFAAPFIFIWIMQAVFGSSGTPVVTIYAVNEDKGRDSARVMDALRSSANLEIEVLKTRDEANRKVGAGERMAAVIVPDGFSEALTTRDGAKVTVLVDPARAEQANIVIGLVNAALGPMIVDAEVSRGVENSVAQIMKNAAVTPTPTETPTGDSLDSGLLDGTPLPFETPTETPSAELTPTPTTGETGSQGSGIDFGSGSPLDAETVKQFFTAAIKGVVSSQVQEAMDHPQVTLTLTSNQTGAAPVRQTILLDYLVPGYSLMFMFFLIPNLAKAVIEERQTGTLRRLLSAPVPRSRILLGKMLPYFLIAVLQFTLVVLISQLAFGLNLGQSALGLAIIILTSALAMAALGILIASFVRTEGQADGAAVAIILAMAVVSGAMFPNIFIPGLQNLTPHYWAMQGFLNVVARAQGANGALLPAGVLITMAAVFFTIGAVRFRFE